MLFNSYPFIFLFLPVCYIGYAILQRLLPIEFRYYATAAWLLLASLFFYSWWNLPDITIITTSILFNFFIVRLLSLLSLSAKMRLFFLWLGILANLTVLFHYKYSYFIAGLFSISMTKPVLPLAVSFFTFQQIAYLVDSYHRQIHKNQFLQYATCVSFFPHLIAGPLVNYGVLYPQFGPQNTKQPLMRNLAIGLSIFIFGLAKKLILADQLALFVNPVFNFKIGTARLNGADVLLGNIAYTFQIYFDFSGYSDMAVGLGRIFGIKLPVNFFSPYKASSIIDFWRRWHITLSDFLRQYLYIPLGGNRFGPTKQYCNLMLTMLLGGIWHGAGFTFVIWGVLHGIFLIINHLWRKWAIFSIPRPLSISLTFLSVAFAWIFFRAESLEEALFLIKSLGQLHSFQFELFKTTGCETIIWCVGAGIIVFGFPNIYQVMYRYRPVHWNNKLISTFDFKPRYVFWRPTIATACLLALVFVYCLILISRTSKFIYYQF